MTAALNCGITSFESLQGVQGCRAIMCSCSFSSSLSIYPFVFWDNLSDLFLCLISLRLFPSHLPVTSLFHSHPPSFNFPHYLSLQISQRGKEQQQLRRLREEKKAVQRKEGGMSFTDVPPGCTHSSRAEHPVLSSPPPPRLTPCCTYAWITNSQTHTMVPTLPSANSPFIDIFFLSSFNFFYLSFFGSYCFPLNSASCTTATTMQSFRFGKENYFLFYLHVVVGL